MNKIHKNITNTTNEPKLSKDKNEISIQDFIDISTQSPLHTLFLISELLNISDN